VTGHRESCGCGWNRKLSDIEGKGKRKNIPVQTLKDPYFEALRIFRQSTHKGSTVVSLTYRPPLRLRRYQILRSVGG